MATYILFYDVSHVWSLMTHESETGTRDTEADSESEPWERLLNLSSDTRSDDGIRYTTDTVQVVTIHQGRNHKGKMT